MISYLSNSKLLSVHEPISGFYSVAIVYIFIYYTLLICLGTWQEKDPLIPSLLYTSILILKCFKFSIKSSIGILIGNALNLCIHMGKMKSIILRFPHHESSKCCMYLYFFKRTLYFLHEDLIHLC